MVVGSADADTIEDVSSSLNNKGELIRVELNERFFVGIVVLLVKEFFVSLVGLYLLRVTIAV